jgi:hypothetical protein
MALLLGLLTLPNTQFAHHNVTQQHLIFIALHTSDLISIAFNYELIHPDVIVSTVSMTNNGSHMLQHSIVLP